MSMTNTSAIAAPTGARVRVCFVFAHVRACVCADGGNDVWVRMCRSLLLLRMSVARPWLATQTVAV
jgi:hypothetical protein